jgi:serine/threonine protein kinase
LKIETQNFPNNGVQYDSGLFQNQNNIRNNVHTNSTLLTHLDEKIQHAIITQNQHNNNNNSCTTASSLENIENNNGSRMNSPNRMKNYVDPAELMPFEQRIRKFVREIYPNALSDQEELATGHFGVVYKAKLTKVENGEKVVKDVAVKQCKNAESELVQGAENIGQEFLREAAILGQLRHENIIRLEGVQYKIRPFLIVTEFMERGSLETFVQTHATQIQDSTLIRLLSDVSNAMSYLNQHYIHRDLAARNILIGYKTPPSRQESGNSSGNSSNQSPSDQHSNKTLALSSEGLASETGEEISNERRLIAKVADFGLAIPCGENFTRMNPGHRSTPTKKSRNPGLTAPINQTEKMVPLRWTSPEALEFEVWSQKSDVWSFGILCFEVLSRGERPFWNLRDNEVIKIVTDLTKRFHVSKILQKPVLINEMIYRQVICPCLESLPERRPDFEHVSYALNSIKDNLPSQSSSSISQHNSNLANSTKIIEFLPTDNYTSSSSLSAYLASIGQIPKSVLYSLLRRNCVTFEQLQHDMLKLDDNPNTWTSFGVPDGHVAGLLKQAVCNERMMPKSEFCVEEYVFTMNVNQSQNTVNQLVNLSQNSGQPQNNSQFRGQQPQQIRAASNEQIRRQFTCHNGMEVVEI